jgi:hypothetical protein
LTQIISDIEILWHLLDIPVLGPLKHLSREDINNIYLEILGFGKRWIYGLEEDFDADLQMVYWSWYDWVQDPRGVFDRDLLRRFFEKWNAILSSTVRKLSEDFYKSLLRMNITCNNSRFSQIDQVYDEDES